MKVLFLGSGRMAQALTVYFKSPEDSLYFYSPSGKSSELLASLVRGHKILDYSQDEYDVVVLGLKPQHLEDLFLPENLKNNKTTIISPLAATPIHKILTKWKNPLQPIIRMMPSLQIEQGRGVNLITFAHVGDEQKMSWLKLFNRGGKFYELDEIMIDRMTLFSGCVPGYLYYILKQVHEFACSHGMDPALTTEIFAYSIQGACSGLDSKSASNWDNLIAAVASKKGVTEQVIQSFDRHPQYFLEAFEAGFHKIKELNPSL